MNKFKDILNDLTNGWTFLYTAIYGMVAFILGIYIATINYFSGINKEFLEMLNYCSVAFCGHISIISIFVLIISRIYNKFSTILKLLLYLLIFSLFYYWYISYANFCMGDLLITLFYIGSGTCLLFLLFIFPTSILLILDLKQKIPPPKINFTNKYIAFIFIIYAIYSFLKLISILKKII